MGATGGILGGSVSAAGQLGTALQQERALRFQGRAERAAAFEQAKLARRQSRGRRARNRSRLAKGGVDLSSGTAVEVIANQAAEDELAARFIEAAGVNARNLRRFQGDQALTQAALGAVTSLIGGATSTLSGISVGGNTLGQSGARRT